MLCSVIIPCHGGADLTRLCVQSLLQQAGQHELEILLIDNARDPATQALAALAPCVRVLPQSHNLGFAGGTNVGLRAARHQLLLVINNDTQAAPNMLARLHAALANDARIAFAAPTSNYVRGEAKVPFGAAGATAEGRARIEDELACERGFIQDVDNLTGLCLLTRRATLDDLGLFDERFGFGNYEDDDLSLRARRAGYRLVIARDAYLHHEGHKTFQSLGLDIAQELRRRRDQFAAKWQTDAAGSALLAGADHAAAAALAQHAQRVLPTWLDADWHIGRHLAESGQSAVAATHLAAFLRHCPNHTGALILLGTCWLTQGHLQPAQHLWSWALAHCHFEAPQAADLLRRLGEHARSRGLLECAIDNFAAAAELDPDNATLHNWLGVSLLEARRFEPAIQALERAAERGFALAHTNLGICHFQAGNAEQALHHFAEASRQLPDDPTARDNHARAQQALTASRP